MGTLLLLLPTDCYKHRGQCLPNAHEGLLLADHRFTYLYAFDLASGVITVSVASLYSVSGFTSPGADSRHMQNSIHNAGTQAEVCCQEKTADYGLAQVVSPEYGHRRWARSATHLQKTSAVDGKWGH